jgi:hypothetical protein
MCILDIYEDYIIYGIDIGRFHGWGLGGFSNEKKFLTRSITGDLNKCIVRRD